MQTRFIPRVFCNPRRLFSSRAPPISSIIYPSHRSRPLIAKASHYSTVGAQVTADHETDGSARRVIEDDEKEGRANYPAKRYPRRTLIVREYDPELTTLDDLRELLSPYGEINQMNLHGRNICFVEFASLTAAKSVIWRHLSHPFTLNNQPLFINYAVDIVEVGNPSNFLWVTGLDPSARPNLDELKVIFSRFGNVENVILNRKGLHSCTVRYTNESEATAAIEAHRLKRMRYRGLALQLRYGRPPNQFAREPNPSLHIMGFYGTPEKLLSYIPRHADRLQDLFMSNPKDESLGRHDVFVKFDSVETATEAMHILNRQLGLAAQYAWPKKTRQTTLEHY